MKNKDIIACGASLYRVLNVADGYMFVMDCLKPKMPFWISGVEDDCKYLTEQELYERTGKTNISLDDLDPVSRRVALNRYTIIAGVLPFLTDANLRANVIKRLARHILLFYLDYYEIKHQELKSCNDIDHLDYIGLHRWLSALHTSRNQKYKDTITKSELDHILWYCYKSFEL